MGCGTVMTHGIFLDSYLLFLCYFGKRIRNPFWFWLVQVRKHKLAPVCRKSAPWNYANFRHPSNYLKSS